MRRADIDGITLEYEVQGSGEPVVCIHGAFFESFGPMAGDPALEDYRVVRYSRRGYAGSKPADTAVPISRQAADCMALLQSLQAAPAHVVGHSSGGVIAMQLALQAPEAVRSLTILEPALLAVPSGEMLFEKITAAIQKYEAGDKPGAFDTFMQIVCGPGYRATLDKAIPGASAGGIAASDSFWPGEFPAVGDWSFTREDAARLTMPTLVVVGANSPGDWVGYTEIHELLLEWLPRAKPFVLPRAGHLLQVENPHEMAVALADFLESNRGT